MKYGVISDIHSNLEALESVLNILADRKVDGYLCLGDLVGYGPNPNEVIERLGKLPNLICVAGNHDRAAIERMDIAWFNSHARAAILWTQQRLTADSRSFLANLPDRMETSRATLVHGTPRDPINEYLLDEKQFSDNASLFSSPLCFVGHSHIPFIMMRHHRTFKLVRPKEGEVVALHPSAKAMVNPGAVGQPRDGDARAAFMIFDEARFEVTGFRTAYDVAAVQEKMSKGRIPSLLIERLAAGR